MDEQHLRALLAEYAALSSSFDKHAAVGYSILPLALTAIGGVAILGQFKGEYVGIGSSLLLLLVIAWIGVSHTLLNRIGLRLVAIELRIRDGLALDMREEPFFFTSFIGYGCPGYNVYFSYFAFIAVLVLFFSMCHWWGTLTTWNYSLACHVVGVAIPVALNIGGVLTMYLIERRVAQQRNALIDSAARTDITDSPSQG